MPEFLEMFRMEDYAKFALCQQILQNNTFSKILM